MIEAQGYAALEQAARLEPFRFQRRDPTPHDVQIDVQFCGLCHTDIHFVRNDWGGSHYPMVPGHEIVGRVVATGSAVSKFRPGDLVGVGCMVDSCRQCSSCREEEQQFCEAGATFTYNSPDRHTGGVTFGGYSNAIVVDEAFTFRIPANLDPAASAPLMCAGITMYSPLRRSGVSAGRKVGIVGLGGLGHMGLKLARAFGAEVVQFTTSPEKRADAIRLGAHDVILSRDEQAMKAHAGTFDLIIDTVSANHELNGLIGMLRRDGQLVLVGIPTEAAPVSAANLVWARRSLSGSLIGGVAETQQMLDFCGQYNITADIELIPMQQINEAFTRTEQADVRYRFVIDMASLNRA